MTTRTSVTSGNWRADDADTWGLGLNNYPAAGEHVVIDTGHTVTLGESNDAGSIKLIGTLAGGGHTLTLNDGGDNEIFDHDGTITGTLNITITGTTNRLLDLAGSSGNVNNLTINASSTTFTLSGTGTHTVAGNLTITAGTLDTGSDLALTVTGDASITGTLTGNASAISLGSLTIESGGTYSAPNASGSTTLTSETSGGYTWRNNSGTFTHNNGTVTTNSSVDTKIRENTFYNLIINQSSSGKFVYWEDTSGNTCTVANDLTITTGRLRGLVASDTVTVTGDVLVDANGTFNHTSVWTGSINHGSLTINSGGTYLATSGTTTITAADGSNFAINNSGTFTHNSGTVDFTGSVQQTTNDGLVLHNVICNNSYSTNGLIYRNSTMNDLTVNAGKYMSYYTGGTGITVNGDATISGSFNHKNPSNASGAYSFGSLTINSGGTYNATSGTTTITGDPGGYPNYAIDIDGTFTHNNGTLKYTGGSGALDLSGTGNLYNFDHATTGTTFIVNNTTIENNLTMTLGNFQGANGNENLTVKGNVTIDSVGQTMSFVGTSEHTFGFLTILNGTYRVQNDTGGFTKVGGIRNVGGTVTNAV